MPDNTALTMTTDPAGKVRPAVSATQDLPAHFGTPPAKDNTAAPAAEDKPADKSADATAETKSGDQTATTGDTTQKAETAADTAAAAAADAKPAEDDAAKREAGLKGELTKERNRRRAAEQNATQNSENLTRALKQLEEAMGKNSTLEAKAQAEADPRPLRETFDTPEAYDKALEDWSGRKAVAVAEAKGQTEKAAADKKGREDAQKAESDRLSKAWTDRQAKFAAEHADFEEVAFNDAVAITPAMSAAIIRTENGPEIAYHFGKNPEAAQRIAQIADPMLQAIEIGRLSHQLSAPKARVSRTPAPPSPIGSNAKVETNEEPSMDAYAATHRITKAREDAIKKAGLRH